MHPRRGEHEVTVDGDAVVELHRAVAHRIDRNATDEVRAGGGDQPPQSFAGFGAEPVVLRSGLRRHHRHRNSPLRKGCRGLTADEPRPDHHSGVGGDCAGT